MKGRKGLSSFPLAALLHPSKGIFFAIHIQFKYPTKETNTKAFILSSEKSRTNAFKKTHILPSQQTFFQCFGPTPFRRKPKIPITQKIQTKYYTWTQVIHFSKSFQCIQSLLGQKMLTIGYNS